MFDLMPFGYERSLLDSFDNFEKEFFKGYEPLTCELPY